MSSALPLNSIPTPAQPTAPPRRKGTLLVVDDEEGPRESLRVIFKDDYEMLMAGDGATAIALASSNLIARRAIILLWGSYGRNTWLGPLSFACLSNALTMRSRRAK